jgi:hypothetical protein
VRRGATNDGSGKWPPSDDRASAARLLFEQRVAAVSPSVLQELIGNVWVMLAPRDRPATGRHSPTTSGVELFAAVGLSVRPEKLPSRAYLGNLPA